MRLSITILLLLSYSIIALAQKEDKNPYQFDCEGAFYQMINNQLHTFSVDATGHFFWAAILPPFTRPLSALSYHLEDGFMYSFDTLTYELVRIYQSGAIQPLGVPTNETTNEQLKTKLTIGEIAEGLFCAYAPDEDKLYWVDIDKNTFVITPPLVGGTFTNLAYHPIKKILYSIGSNSRLYTLSPINKQAYESHPMVGLSRGPKGAPGNLWITVDGRLFVTRAKGTSFHELNEESTIAYSSKEKLRKTEGDGTSCPQAYAPAIIDDEILEWKSDKPNRGRIMLRWKGVHEINNKSYVVEQSIDNKNWKAREEKPSPGLKVYSNPYGSLSYYTKEKINYYRLKKTYNYGRKLMYSRTIAINLDVSQPNIILSPKTSFDNHALALYVSGNQGAVLEIEILDINGHVIRKKEQPILEPEITLSFDVHKFPTGFYFLNIKTPKGVKKDWFWVQ
jgi:hypothetical protein